MSLPAITRSFNGVRTRRLLLTIFLICATLISALPAFVSAAPAKAATISKVCSVYNGFNYNPSVHETVGYLTSLQIGDHVFTPDLTVMTPGGTKTVIGVMESAEWEGGPAQPVHLSSQVSEANQQLLSMLVHTSLPDTSVVFTFEVWEYDRDFKAFYPSFHTGGTDHHGMVLREGGALAIYLSDEPGGDVESPENYNLTIGIAPSEAKEVLNLAISLTTPFVLPWGVGWDASSYSLSVATTPGGAVTQYPLPTAGAYPAGTTVTLTASPNEGYVFDGWSGAVSATNNTIDVYMDANKSVTASFSLIPMYRLSIADSPDQHGSISVVPAMSAEGYEPGTVVTLTAQPDAGYIFTGWGGALSGTANPATLIMDSNKSVSASFDTAPTYSLVMGATNGGSISRTPAPDNADGTYTAGTEVTVTAKPISGYEFTGWGGALSGTTNPATIVMDANKTITASFTEIPAYTLTVSISNGGTVTRDVAPGTDGKYEPGTVVTLTALAESDYMFDHWSGDASGTDPSVTITMDADKSVSASFTEIPQYILFLAASSDMHGDYEVSPAMPSGGYYPGTEVNITAVPDTGYEFTGWGGALSGTTNPATLVMNNNKTVSASFEAIPQYILFLAASSDMHGNYEVSPAMPAGGYYPGTEVTITAVPDTGYQFTGWGSDLSGVTDNPATLVMDSNKTVSVSFEAIPQYTLFLAALSDMHGDYEVSPAMPAGGYYPGTEVTITAVPDTGYQFTGWGGALSGTTNPATIIMDANKTVSASFASVNQPPVAIGQDITVELDASGEAAITVADVDNGSYDPEDSIASITLDKTLFGGVDLGPNTVTMTVTDTEGLSDSCQVTVTVADVILPTIIAPPNITVYNDPGKNYATVTDLGSPVANDNSGIFTVSRDGPATYYVGTSLITWKVTDGAGNIATARQRVVTIDNEPPTIATPADITFSTDPGVAYATLANIGTPVVQDNASGAVAIVNDAPADGMYQLGVTTVTWTASDAYGNEATAYQTITIIDDEAPFFVFVPPNTIIEEDAIPYQPEIIVTDNAGPVDIVYSETITNIVYSETTPNFVKSYMLKRRWVATDAAGNSATATQDIIVLVNQPPVAIGLDITVALDESGQAVITAADVDNGSYDPEDAIASITLSKTVFTAADLGPNIVIMMVTDAKDLADICWVTVTVVDNTPPVLTLPADIMAYTDHDPYAYIYDIGEATAVDNSGYCIITRVPADIGPQFAPGVTQITWVAIDASNNSVSSIQTITVIDADAPEFLYVPADITVNTDPGLNTAVVTWTPPTVVDNYDTDLEVQSTHLPGDTFPMGTTLVTYTSTDAAGNTATASFNMTVVDVEPPVLTMPDEADIVITYNTGEAGAVVSWPNATATDNDGIASITSDLTSGVVYPISPAPYVVTFTATDWTGNQATGTIDFMVADIEPPTIAAPADITFSTDPGVAYATLANIGTPVVQDNAGGAVTIANDAPADGVYQLGVTTVTWTASDAYGNEATAYQTITIIDDEAPVFTSFPEDINVPTLPDRDYANVSWERPVAVDNVATSSMSYNAKSGDPFPIGVHVVTYTAYDQANNSVTDSFTITVYDGQPPTIATPADITFSTDPGVAYATLANIGTPVVQDNAGGAVAIANDAPADGMYQLGVTTVTWTASDAYGNEATAYQTITIIDDEAPVLGAIPEDITVDGEENIPPIPEVTATDNSGEVSIECIETTGNTYDDRYELERHWIAMDNTGNHAEATQIITVLTNQPPVAIAADVTVEAGPGGLAEASINAGSYDPDGDPLTVTLEPAGPYPLGATLVTLTVTDPSGASASATATITVVDTTAPAIDQPEDMTVEADSEGGTASVSLPAITATDIANGDVTVTSDAPDFYPLGETIVTWTAADTSGNTASASMTVTVVDTTAPEVTILSPANGAVFYPDATIDIDYQVTDIADTAPFITITPANPVTAPLTVGDLELKVTATDASGNTAEASFTVTVLPLEATIDFDPDTVNTGANGQWFTAYIEMPGAEGIDGSTVMLNGQIPAYIGKQGWARAEAGDGNILDRDGDGIPERMVKFESAAATAILPLGEEVEITITGEAAGITFSGSDTIRIIDEGTSKEQTNNGGGNSSSNGKSKK